MTRIRNFALLASLAVITAFAALAVACGGDDDGDHGAMGGMGSVGGDMSTMRTPPEGAIRVGLVNWAVEPAQATAKAGQVTFWAVHEMDHGGHGSNEGGDVHDLQVMKKRPDGKYDLIGQVQGLRMGEARALTLTLEAGDYELACNVVEKVGGKSYEHYGLGMYTAFRVTS
jgi:uncharacterized cupredoxin-like copper-binding protein